MINESSEVILTRKTGHPSQVKKYMSDKKIPEGQARDLVARDLMIGRADERSEKNKNLAMIDSQTGFYNKLWLYGNDKIKPPVKSNLQILFELAERHGHKLTAIMIDIDHFRDYNTNFGHLEGNKALSELAKICFESTRDSDFWIRFGGEEFLLLLPETDLAGSEKVAEKIRKAVKESRSFRTNMTISSGLVSYPFEEIDSASKLIGAADAALYHSKKTGRNQVTVWQEEYGINDVKK